MRITDLQAYRSLHEWFYEKEYEEGKKDDMPIYCWDDVRIIPENLTPGHFVDALKNSRITLADVPSAYRTREFFFCMHFLVCIKMLLNMLRHILISSIKSFSRTISQQTTMH